MEHDKSHRKRNRTTIEASLSATEKLCLSRAIPCYGLPGRWPGFRTIGDSELVNGSGQAGEGGQTVWEDHYETWELLHGTIGRSGPCLAVESSNAPPDNRLPLVERLRTAAVGETEEPMEIVTLDVLVDGRLWESSGFSLGFSWAVRWQLTDHWVTVVANRWLKSSRYLELVTVEDLGPYFVGRRSVLLPPHAP